MRPMYASTVHASVTRGPRLGPPIDGCARKIRKNRIAVGGIVAAPHIASQCITGLLVSALMNVQPCQNATVNENAANEVYIRSERDRSSTEVPTARISSAASRADTAWASFSTRAVY